MIFLFLKSSCFCISSSRCCNLEIYSIRRANMVSFDSMYNYWGFMALLDFSLRTDFGYFCGLLIWLVLSFLPSSEILSIAIYCILAALYSSCFCSSLSLFSNSYMHRFTWPLLAFFSTIDKHSDRSIYISIVVPFDLAGPLASRLDV